MVKHIGLKGIKRNQNISCFEYDTLWVWGAGLDRRARLTYQYRREYETTGHFKYDSMLHKNVFYIPPAHLVSEWFLEYERGNEVKEIKYSAKDSIRWTQEYGRNGKPVVRTELRQHNGISDTTIFHYTYPLTYNLDPSIIKRKVLALRTDGTIRSDCEETYYLRKKHSASRNNRGTKSVLKLINNWPPVFEYY